MDKTENQKIPKIIHYCWFGRNPLPELAQKCIASWKKYCPDYQIIEWNEENFDIHCNAYVEEAYRAKKWAFVSDVARFKILYQYGGIYFDTDVELIRPIDDLLEQGAFMARETGQNFNIAPGLVLAVNEGNEIYNQIINHYDSQHFIHSDGSFDLSTVVTRVTRIMLNYGYNPKVTTKIQDVGGILIYPPEYFCPKDYATGKIEITHNTVSIHHYQGSWLSEEDKYYDKLKKTYQKFLPKQPASYLAKYISGIKYQGFVKGNKFLFGWIKRKNNSQS